MTPRCEIQVPPSTYSAGGRCSKTAGVKPTVILEGTDKLTVKACRHHRAMVEGNKAVQRARRCSKSN